MHAVHVQAGVKPTVTQLGSATLLDAVRVRTGVYEAVGAIRTLQRPSTGRFGAGPRPGELPKLDRLRWQTLHWMKTPYGRRSWL